MILYRYYRLVKTLPNAPALLLPTAQQRLTQPALLPSWVAWIRYLRITPYHRRHCAVGDWLRWLLVGYQTLHPLTLLPALPRLPLACQCYLLLPAACLAAARLANACLACPCLCLAAPGLCVVVVGLVVPSVVCLGRTPCPTLPALACLPPSGDSCGCWGSVHSTCS